ncbi:MAG: CoA transferase [Cyclobacteriaceae bacterium]|nr:CoA transferase [Cyclobacteriaceae bacterium]
MNSDTPFADLVVLELASVLAGPSVGQFFAELGAEVIKIENPRTGGDVTRSWRGAGENTDDRSAYFCSCNWGKKSVLLDLSLETDREKMLRLAEKSDIIIASYKPGDAEKLGVGYEQMKAVNPAVIYGMITGYGPEDDRVGYDAVIQAESGFMDLNGEKDGPPVKMPVALIDILAAHQLKEGLLLALLKKERTGEGSRVEVSLLETALASLANQATNWTVGGKVPSRQGSAHPNIAPYGDTFVTADGKLLLLAVGNDRQFESLLEAVGIPPSDRRVAGLKTNPDRVRNREELNDLLARAISKCQSLELVGDLHRRKVPAGLIRNVREALEDPLSRPLRLDAAGLTGLRGFVGVGPGWASQLSAPPHLGEHTQEVLSRLL